MFFVLYGTKLLGRKNLVIKNGRCSHCGRITTLKSFIARKWGHIYYIPLIPLEKIQVVDLCSSCNTYRFFKIAEWNRIRNDEIQKYENTINNDLFNIEAITSLSNFYNLTGRSDDNDKLIERLEQNHNNKLELLLFLFRWYKKNGNVKKAGYFFDIAYEQEPGNPELALIMFEKKEAENDNEIMNFADELYNRFYKDINVLKYLAKWYSKKQFYFKEMLCYERIFSVKPDDDTAVYKIASRMIKNSDPDKAKEILIKDNVPVIKSNFLILYELSKCYLDLKEYKKAYDIILVIKKYFSTKSKNDKYIKKILEFTEIKLGIKKTIFKFLVSDDYKNPGITQKLLLPAVLSIFAVFILSLLIILNLWLSKNQKLYIVNHLRSDAFITVDGNFTYEIPEDSLNFINISEGKHTLYIKYNNQKGILEQVNITNTIYSRMFNVNTYIYNISGAGFIIWEKLKYSVNPDPDEITPHEIYVGNTFINLKNIHYVFENSPETIDVGSYSYTYRTIVSAFSMAPEEVVDYLIEDKFDNIEIINYIEAQILGGYIEKDFINLYKKISGEYHDDLYAEEFLGNNLISYE